MRRPVATLAAQLEHEPWHTPLGLASGAVSRAEQAVDDLALAPESRHTLAPEAVRQLVRARRFVLDATVLLGQRAGLVGHASTQQEREQLVYLGAVCDGLARRLGFKPVERAAA